MSVISSESKIKHKCFTIPKKTEELATAKSE